MLVELEKITKIYNQNRPNEVIALDDISLEIRQRSTVCIRGASGSGKSTLLAVIGCLFPPTSGKAAIAGKRLSRMPDRFLTLHRRRTIGFIFQQFNVLPGLTAIDNITLPLLPLGISPKKRKQMAGELMEQLSIDHRASFPVDQISGGELQRVVIARALINDPPIILADEPTAHLDSRLSMDFMAVMDDLGKKGKTIIIASHDRIVAEHPAVDRVIDIKDGRIDVP